MQIFELRSWDVREKNPGVWKAHGECYNNPRFFQGQRVHTSPIEKVIRCSDGWMLTTMSGSCYILRDSEVTEHEERRMASMEQLNKMIKDT